MREQLNEQEIVTNFISKVFDAIVRDRNRALTRAMEKDPNFKKIMADVERTKKDLHSWIEQRIQKDPELAKRLAQVRSL